MVEVAKTQKGNSRGLKGLLQPFGQWLPEKQRLFQEFMDNLKGQLSDVQKERWPRFERTLRREHALVDSDLDGEGVDLVSIARQMQISPDAMAVAQAAFDDYEAQLDQALQARDRSIDKLMPDMTNAMEEMDMDRGVALQMQIMKQRIAVRVVQDESIEKIAAALPAPVGAEFRQRALAAGYKEAFQPDPLGSFFQVVSQLTDLTPEQRSGVDAARAKWDSALEGLRARMLQTIREDQPNKPIRSTKAAQARLAAKRGQAAEPAPTDAMVPLRNEKNRLVQETRDAVMALLTDEQKDKIRAGVPGLRPMNTQTDASLMEGGAHRGGADAAGAKGDAEEDKPTHKEAAP
jgi:hypothetical protein